ncbi:hypothetical protein ABZ915_27220 [Streptomyces sp. NPDC046915]|uniref:hypothetical protein n=1 Tax=Streptomyces sp. NPDC046915 TaxID=3155257 RepID=UPI0033CA13B2
MKLNKLAAAAAGAGIALSATVVGVATPAMASTNCTTWMSGDRATGYGKCTGGDTRFDTHRVKVVCIGPNGHTFNVFGKWVNTRAGETSKGVCSTNPRASGVEVYRMSIETDRL